MESLHRGCEEGRLQAPFVVRGLAGVVVANALAYEKAGAYDVVVEHASSRPWSRANVRVTRGECHVETVSLTALLQR